MRVVVASTNPVKIEATRQAFGIAFPAVEITFVGVSVPSGVSDQPMTDEETLQGAQNRAHNAQSTHPDADFWVGLEGGVEHREGALMCFAWMAVYGKDGRHGYGRTATFALPDEVAVLIHEGKELGDADDIVFGLSNSKQKNGSIGILTGDRLTRETFYTPAVLLALIPFLNPELTFPAPIVKA
jgi:inosine/xanthosine triphosphatase